MRGFYALLALAFAAPAAAHVISMSSGELRISGNQAHFELRMPIYEIQHVADPAKALLGNVRFTSGGGEARVVDSSCAEDKEDGSFRCTATLEWPREVERFHVRSTLPSITVPNHVFLLRAYLNGKTDQAVLDFSNPEAEVRFRPPTAFEVWAEAAAGGFMRAFSSPVAVLFLGCLVLAARNRRELIAAGGMFVTGEVAAALTVPHTGWSPAPRFVEAALALTLAYLAVEILLLPKAGQRWAVAGFLGVFHGLAYAIYMEGTGYRPFPVLTGMAIADVLAVALFGLVVWLARRRLPGLTAIGERVAAGALLVGGLAWFILRLRAY